MDGDLSKRARNWLLARLKKAANSDSYTVKAIHPALREILAWCDEAELVPGRTLGAGYVFETGVVPAIDAELQARGFAALSADLSGRDRARASELTVDEKQAGVRPTERQVLLAITDPRLLAAIAGRLYPSAGEIQQSNLEADVELLDLSSYQQLVVIENRDTFNDWHRYAARAGLSRPLVVYRGHEHWHSRACKTLLRRWHAQRADGPSVYFGDCDLAGLRIAVSAGYRALLTPPHAWLEANLIRAHYPSKQLKYLPQLVREAPPGWRGLLRQLSTGQAGLRQQWMTSAPLGLLYR